MTMSQDVTGTGKSGKSGNNVSFKYFKYYTLCISEWTQDNSGTSMITLVKVSTYSSITELAGMASEIWNEYFPPVIGQDQVDYMVDKFQSIDAINKQINSGYDYYFVSEDGHNVGYTGLVGQPDKGALQISKLYLLKDWRGRGIAGEVLDSISEMALLGGYNKLYLTVNKYNHLAISTYEKYGFTRSGDIVMDIGGGYVMDDYEMQRILS